MTTVAKQPVPGKPNDVSRHRHKTQLRKRLNKDSWATMNVCSVFRVIHKKNNYKCKTGGIRFYARQQVLLWRVLAIAIPSVRPSVRPSVCLFLRPSHEWISQKRCKLGLPNYHLRCLEDSSFRNRKAFP